MVLKKLNILALADIHSSDNFHLPDLSEQNLDIIITLGDIDSGTIDYILFMAKDIPVISVQGNHDPEYIPGLNSIHCKTVKCFGYTFGGFSGAIKYKDHPHHYTEKYTAKKISRIPRVDIFISHSPPFSISQKEDINHQGFKAFDNYIAKHKPAYWIHGHLGSYYLKNIGQTTVIGVDNKRYLTLEF